MQDSEVMGRQMQAAVYLLICRRLNKAEQKPSCKSVVLFVATTHDII